MTVERGLYSRPTISIIHNGFSPKKKLHDSLELLKLCPGIYILMNAAV
jgi:hypothetical protein